MTAVVVLAKAPVAGRVKTRLVPAYSGAEAAALAEAALADTLRAVCSTPGVRPVLCLAGDRRDVERVVAPHRGLLVLRQRGDGLADRIAWAFDDAAAALGGHLLLVGMDTPQVTPLQLARAAHALRTRDAVHGPAADGGWWLLGLRRAERRLFDGVRMSTSTTGRQQLARLRGAGLRVAGAPLLRDVDTAQDAAAVAGLAPAGAFARAWRALGSRTGAAA